MTTRKFSVDMKAFLTDPDGATLLRDTIRGHLCSMIESLKTDLKRRDDRIDHLETRLEELEERNDTLEQYTRRNSVRINGISESAAEDCENKVLSTFNEKMSLSPLMTMVSIDRMHRIGKPVPGKHRSIIVKFATYHQCKRVLSKRSSLRGSDIFINEDLTKHRNNLLYIARQFKKKGGITDCWSYDGRILIKDNKNLIREIKKTH
ncbi:hypothetical protein CAPTEDRAFT_187669 [Capitella teleta]|uniref:L1 transposable element RRM domain-containing protein n=1 Tax=Capitella teleta TaxID=283909 RepID=R7U5D8_CAPTE|nr:hypothetical protein CAPTEDRAFT_187669 [Capitella teleta]|eukprot:ELU01331.1 hypothetical protein CAPTEDRAFT_187669 [Capitella teleta]